jgi:hypothetical protein
MQREEQNNNENQLDEPLWLERLRRWLMQRSVCSQQTG